MAWKLSKARHLGTSFANERSFRQAQKEVPQYSAVGFFISCRLKLSNPSCLTSDPRPRNHGTSHQSQGPAEPGAGLETQRKIQLKLNHIVIFVQIFLRQLTAFQTVLPILVHCKKAQ